MKKFFLFIGIMVIAAVAHAATYEWTDSGGGKHFTDDPDKIPAKYRKKSRELNLEPVTEGKEKQPVVQPEQPPIPKQQKSASLPGGHNEAWWRSSFKALRDELKLIQDNLPAKREKLTTLGRKRTLFHKASDRTAYNSLNDEIDRDEARMTELHKQLADLEAEATRAGVPLEWRQ
jgi:hypothetical protein